MKTLQIISVLFILAGTNCRMDAQINLKTTTIETNQSNTSLKDTLVHKFEHSEFIPTPEQQGFTKFILPNGKEVYTKTENGVTIIYKPNN